MKIQFIEFVAESFPLDSAMLEECRLYIHSVTIHKLDNDLQKQRIEAEIINGKIEDIINKIPRNKCYNHKFQIITPRKIRLSSCTDSLGNTNTHADFSPIENKDLSLEIQQMSPSNTKLPKL